MATVTFKGSPVHTRGQLPVAAGKRQAGTWRPACATPLLTDRP